MMTATNSTSPHLSDRLRLPAMVGLLRALQKGGAVSSLILAATLTAQAEVRIDRSAEAFVELSIFGAITERDAKTFAELSRELEYKNAFVDLNSDGGSVSSAMQIGRQIRKYDATTTVPEN
jgi:hypothetical protein